MSALTRLRTGWLIGLLALALVAAACGSDGEDSSGSEAAPEESAPTEEDETPAPTEDAAEPPSDTTPEATEAPTEEAPEDVTAENFASFRGVTEDTIKVGVVVPDFEALRQLGVQNYWGDFETAYQPFFDAINESGGIHGRMIEPHYAGFDWLVPETQEQACTELTQDHEVFIALGGLLSDANLCFTDLNDTMLMSGGFLTDELRERSGDTIWLALDAVQSAAVEVLGQVVAATGELDGKSIGIITGEYLDGGSGGDDLQATLADLGYDSTVAVVSAPIDDETANNAEMDIVVQRFMADGIDFVFFVLNGAGAYDNFDAAGYEPAIADASLGASVEGAEDPSWVDGVLGVGSLPDNDAWADPDFTENCTDVVLAAHPELEDAFAEQVPTGPEQAEGKANWFGPIYWACNHAMLLKELGEIAGAELTNDTLRAALDELGPVTLYGSGQGSLRSADKWDALDEFYIQQYNAAADTIELIGDPVVLDR